MAAIIAAAAAQSGDEVSTSEWTEYHRGHTERPSAQASRAPQRGGVANGAGRRRQRVRDLDADLDPQ
eukprot:gene42531-23778_t